MSPVEGWYADPAGDPGLERYWDGSQWTHNTRPIPVDPVPPPPAPVEASIPPPPAPVDATPNPVGAVDVPDTGALDTGVAELGDLAGSVDLPDASPFEQPTQVAPSIGVPAAAVSAADPGIPGLPPAPAADLAVPPAPAVPDVDPGLPPAPAADVAAAVPGVPPAPAAVAAAPSMSRSADYGASIGGISTELLTDDRYAEVQSTERVVRQNSRLLKVQLGDDVLAKQGSMVAFQGQIDFNYEGSGAAKFLKKAVTGEGLPLMRCSGQGELFLADSAFQVHIIHLAGAGLTVSGKNVLAFEPSLSWDIERLKGGAMMAGGLFNTRLEGHGWVAITTDGDPVVLRTDQPTFADTDAAVAWSSSLTTTVNSTVKAGAIIGRGSGEAVQLMFQGEGIVIVQPSEGSAVPPHSH